MELMYLLLIGCFVVFIAATKGSPSRRQQILPLGDAGPLLGALASRLGLRDSQIDGRVWTTTKKISGRNAYLRVELEPAGGDGVSSWLVLCVHLTVDATLPGEVMLGTRARGREEPELGGLVPAELDAAYWIEGEPAEVLATFDAALSRELVAAERAAPRWTRVALGESAVFERITDVPELLSDLESSLPALFRLTSACVIKIPRSDTIPPLLRRRVLSEDEPLAARLRCAHALLTGFGRTQAARQLADAVDDLPEPLYNPCALWSPGRSGDPADSEGAFVELLVHELSGADADGVYAALVGAGWRPSPAALLTLDDHGVDVSARLDALRAEGAGRLTISDAPDRGGLSPAKGERGGLTGATRRRAEPRKATTRRSKKR